LSIQKLELEKPVITPSLYGPKFTHLQNTIEFHHPDLHEECGRALIGQLGDSGTCGKWLRTRETKNSRSELVFALEQGNVSLVRFRVDKEISTVKKRNFSQKILI